MQVSRLPYPVSREPTRQIGEGGGAGEARSEEKRNAPRPVSCKKFLGISNTPEVFIAEAGHVSGARRQKFEITCSDAHVLRSSPSPSSLPPPSYSPAVAALPSRTRVCLRALPLPLSRSFSYLFGPRIPIFLCLLACSVPHIHPRARHALSPSLARARVVFKHV